eukprot:gene19788-biopygen818
MERDDVKCNQRRLTVITHTQGVLIRVYITLGPEDTFPNLSGCLVTWKLSTYLPGGGIDGDGNRSAGLKVGEHLGLAVGDVLVSGDDGSNGVSGGGAGGHLPQSGDIGVGGLSLALSASVGDDPVEGVVHESSLASVVDGVAGHKHLLGDGNEGVSGKEPLSLDVSGGGEGPAGSALPLVLDVGDGTLGSPVDGVGGQLVLLVEVSRGGGVSLGVEGLGITEAPNLYIRGPVSELIYSESGKWVQNPNLDSLSQVALETSVPKLLLLNRIMSIVDPFEVLKHMRGLGHEVFACAHQCQKGGQGQECSRHLAKELYHTEDMTRLVLSGTYVFVSREFREFPKMSMRKHFETTCVALGGLGEVLWLGKRLFTIQLDVENKEHKDYGRAAARLIPNHAEDNHTHQCGGRTHASLSEIQQDEWKHQVVVAQVCTETLTFLKSSPRTLFKRGGRGECWG